MRLGIFLRCVFPLLNPKDGKIITDCSFHKAWIHFFQGVNSAIGSWHNYSNDQTHDQCLTKTGFLVYWCRACYKFGVLRTEGAGRQLWCSRESMLNLIAGLSNYIGRESKVWGDSGEDSIMRQAIEAQDYWHRGCYHTGY